MKALTKSTSTPALPRNVSPGPARSMLGRPESGILNTIPDPRTPSPSRLGSSSAERPETPRHPDLNDEVATLSTKLINAINHQTNLDDNLQQARAELEMARRRIEQLEANAQEHERIMRRMVKKDDYDSMEMGLRKQLLEEKKARYAADHEKKRIENELETLTTALFQEANTMVAAARKDTEAADRRTEHFKAQLKDTEGLLASQQEQLRDLKEVMAAITAETDDKETTATNTHTSTAPSTPAVVPADRSSRASERASLTPNTPHDEEVEPAHPLHFTHLISPVLRTDIDAYSEFQELLRTAKTHVSTPSSRTTSGNYGGLNVMGLGSLANISTASLSLQPTATNSSETSLPKSVVSVNKETGSILPALKEIKFYKRALTEDIEPTLRLDNAPGLSWLARRTVLNSMTAGSLTIEPQPPYARYRGPVFACSLCGENRVSKVMNKDGTDPYARKHRFRTSDEKDAQRYPLCDFCLGRVRSCCDYIGFLRLCRDGHWRAENGDEEKSAWEESVRLRERMFWARIGGGVIPAYIHPNTSPKSPMVEKRRSGAAEPRKSVESELRLSQEEKGAVDSAPDAEKGASQEGQGEEDPLNYGKQEKRIDIGRTVVTITDVESGLEQKQDSAIALDSEDERRIETEAAEQLQSEMRKSLDERPTDDTAEADKEADKEADDKRAESETQPAETPEIESEKTATPVVKAEDDDEKKSVATEDSNQRASIMPGGFE